MNFAHFQYIPLSSEKEDTHLVCFRIGDKKERGGETENSFEKFPSNKRNANHARRDIITNASMLYRSFDHG